MKCDFCDLPIDGDPIPIYIGERGFAHDSQSVVGNETPEHSRLKALMALSSHNDAIDVETYTEVEEIRQIDATWNNSPGFESKTVDKAVATINIDIDALLQEPDAHLCQECAKFYRKD